MLQIVQGSYFRQVGLTSKVHRSTFYTNLLSMDERALDFVFGRLLPSTNFHGLRTLTIEANEQLEAEGLNGQREMLAATSGDQLLDEIAAVIAFCTNATCVRDYDMARRLISLGNSSETRHRGPASLLRQTFDADVILSNESAQDLDQFVRTLVKLRRKSYEAALRAIRQIVAATLLVSEDAALAYTLMVAALESLGQTTNPNNATWHEYDAVKRKRIDDATESLDAEAREGIRHAVLANEHLGLQRRFVAFVLEHIEPSYYRSEAVAAIRPITATDLPNALRQAYAIRSRNVHALEGLSRELWMIGDRSDTAHLNSGTVLTPEGLARLSRHVIRRFVERQPTDVDTTFNYRSALPGIVSVRLASRYWIGNSSGFNLDTAGTYFSGLLDLFIEVLSGRDNAGLVDMTGILENIEGTALSISKRKDRLPMAGIMQLWNAVAPEKYRRTLKRKLAAKFEADLAEPSIVSFAVAEILGHKLIWSTEQLEKLANERHKERITKNAIQMPGRIDAALHIVLSDRFLAVNNIQKCLKQLEYAIETVPGTIDLIKFEELIKAGQNSVLHLDRFVFGEAKFIDLSPEDMSLPISSPGRSTESAD